MIITMIIWQEEVQSQPPPAPSKGGQNVPIPLWRGQGEVKIAFVIG